MPTPFPGMDPYLERRGLWREVHTGLIVEIQHALTPLLRPRYRVAVEQRTYLALVEEETFAGRPDVLVMEPAETMPESQPMPAVAETAAPYAVDLPMPDEVVERHLEVREAGTGRVITVIEILSPSNKVGEGRRRCERKRLRYLGSASHLVEIDLLRAGRSLPMRGQVPEGDYRLLVSRFERRPHADVFPFTVRDPIPSIPIPLRPGAEEPVLPLNDLLHGLYDRAGYDLAIDYARPPEPPLSDADAAWAQQLLADAGVR